MAIAEAVTGSVKEASGPEFAASDAVVTALACIKEAADRYYHQMSGNTALLLAPTSGASKNSEIMAFPRNSRKDEASVWTVHLFFFFPRNKNINAYSSLGPHIHCSHICHGIQILREIM